MESSFLMPIEQLYMSLFSGTICGAVAYYLAYRRGRNPWIWAILGFFFALLGVVVLLLLPQNKKSHVVSDSAVQSLKRAQDFVAKGFDISLMKQSWFYASVFDQQPLGPVGFEELQELWNERKINSETLVWTQGWQDWLSIESVRGMRPILDAKKHTV